MCPPSAKKHLLSTCQAAFALPSRVSPSLSWSCSPALCILDALPTRRHPCSLYLSQASAWLQLRPPKPPLPPSPVPQPLPVSNSTYAPGSMPVAGSQTEEAPLVQQPSHKASIYAVALNPAGSVVACGSSDHMIRLWDTRSREKFGAMARARVRTHVEGLLSVQGLLVLKCHAIRGRPVYVQVDQHRSD
eukprot:220318-Pelagomonas_calceolata.AAC.6